MSKSSTATSLANSFRTIANSRHSVKRFQPGKSIPKEHLTDILKTSLTSPSGFNIQPTQVILVQDQSVKEYVSKHAMLGAGNKYRTVDASLLAVFLSDLEIVALSVPNEGTDVSLSSQSDSETPRKRQRKEQSQEEKIEKMTDACRTILECIGEDPEREGLLKTPDRWAKALLFMTKGYCQRVEDVTNNAIFSENHEEMVVVRDIDIHSLCEHHMLPFTGKIHVGYIPRGKILGLSKIARIAEIFARRLQVQERMTSEVADAIVDAVNPLGVAVVVECSHFCMVMRGVQKSGSTTVTSSVRGCFKTCSKTRAEFFSIVRPYGR